MGSCEALVRQLHSDSPSKQLEAITALSVLPLTPRNWLSVVGAIPRLAQLLLHSTSMAPARAHAIRCLLRHISTSCPSHEARGLPAAPDGIVPSLVPLLRQDSDAHVCQAAARALSTLALSDINREKIVEGGAVVPLTMQLLKSDSEDLQMGAVRALMDLTCENKAGQIQVAAAGAIAPTVRLLQATRSEQFESHAIMLLANLASNEAKPVVEAGAIPLIVKRLTGSPLQTQMAAACALGVLSNDSSNHAVILAAAPLLPLVRLLTSSSEAETQEYARKTLLLLAKAPTFPQQFIAAGAAPSLVHLVRSGSASMRQLAGKILDLLAAMGESGIFACLSTAATSALPLLDHLQIAASSEEMRYEAGKLLQARTTGMTSSAAGSSSTAAAVHALPPAAASPQQQQQQQQPPPPRKSCRSCGATGVPLKKCSVCAVAAYCGAGCQKADWKVHKGQCAGLKAGASGSGSSAAGEK